MSTKCLLLSGSLHEMTKATHAWNLRLDIYVPVWACTHAILSKHQSAVQWWQCHSGVTVVLQWCRSGVAAVSQWCHSSVTMSQWFHSGVTVVSQWCHSCVTVLSHRRDQQCCEGCRPVGFQSSTGLEQPSEQQQGTREHP